MKFTMDGVELPEPVTTTSILEMSRKLASDRGQAIEAYIRFYMETTGDNIRDVELVHVQGASKADAVVTSYFIRRRAVTP